MFQIDKATYEYDEHGFIKQLNPKPFNYTQQYNGAQSTNEAMSYLRIGFMLSYIPYDEFKKAIVLELGPGKGVFFEILKKHVAKIDGYDIDKDSPYSTVSIEQAYKNDYDIIVACDVIEHFSEINDIWKFNFKYAYFSFPWTPEVLTYNYRHRKPDEHLYHIYPKAFVKFAQENGYNCSYSSPEDTIRTRWDKNIPNICSVFLSKISK